MPVAEPSAAVREHLGVDGVCEPCALLAATAGLGESVALNAPQARLLVRKTVVDGVTVAIASSDAHADSEHPNNDTQEQDLP
jgi:cobalamin biosynthesis protein CbiG